MIGAMEEKAYEMLWDCEFCGNKKLLGKTHRFCPGCGAPQNPKKRYFPSDEDKVLAKDHEYFGADKVCPHCKAAVSARMKFCSQCGGGMDGAASVRRVGEPEAKPAPAAASGGGGKSGFGKVVAVLAVVVIAGIGLSMALRSCKKAVVLSVAGHSWVRQVPVERYESVRRSDWCGEMRSGAYNIERRSEAKEDRQVEDGQTCKTVKTDQGDGTFVEKEECETRYRTEKVYADKCRYSVDDWHAVRTEKKSGQSLGEAPSWPPVRLAREGDCRGCEREGARAETYTVRFSAEGKDYSCDFKDEGKWRSFAPGSRWAGDVKLGGSLACEGLKPAS